jgi:hypothetical protein
MQRLIFFGILALTGCGSSEGDKASADVAAEGEPTALESGAYD